MRTIQKTSLRICWLIGLFALIGLVNVIGRYASSDRPIMMALGFGPIFVTIVYLLCGMCIAVARPPVGSGDIVRVILWTAFGFAEGVRTMARGYFKHFWPQYSDPWTFAATAVEGIVLVAIVDSLFIAPLQPRARQTPPSGCGNVP